MVEIIKEAIKLTKAVLIVVTAIFFIDIIGIVNYINRKTGTWTALSKLLLNEQTIKYYFSFYVITIVILIGLVICCEIAKQKECADKLARLESLIKNNGLPNSIKCKNNTRKIFNTSALDIHFLIGLLGSFIVGLLLILELIITNNLTAAQYLKFSFVVKIMFSPIGIYVIIYIIIEFFITSTSKLKISQKTEEKISGKPKEILTKFKNLSNNEVDWLYTVFKNGELTNTKSMVMYFVPITLTILFYMSNIKVGIENMNYKINLILNVVYGVIAFVYAIITNNKKRIEYEKLLGKI